MLIGSRLSLLFYINLLQDLFMGCLQLHMQLLLVRPGITLVSKSADVASCSYVTACGWSTKQDHNHHPPGISKGSQRESAIGLKVIASCMPSSSRSRLEISPCRRCEKIGEGGWSWLNIYPSTTLPQSGSLARAFSWPLDAR